MIRAIVSGAAGKMGSRMVALIHQSGDIRVAGGVGRADHPALGRDLGEIAGIGKIGVSLESNLEAIIEGADVVIDFSIPETSLARLKIVAKHGKAMVIGTTGFSGTQLKEVRELTQNIPCVLSPNLSVGVNLVFKLLQQIAPILGDDYDVEVLETHHRFKKDAPSGTALRMGEILAKALERNLDEVGVYGRKGIVGERTRKEIALQAVRAGDTVGDHTVIFGGIGERIEITHRSHSRDNFGMGGLKAIRWIVGQKPGLYDMFHVLGL